MADDALTQSTSMEGLLSSLATTLVQHDPAYVYCVMNSGLFKFIPKAPETKGYVYGEWGDGSGSVEEGAFGGLSLTALRALAAGLGIDSEFEVGACSLSCVGTSVLSACCDAAARVRECQLSSAAHAYTNYSRMVEDILSLKSRCSPVAASTVALWTISAVIFVVIAVLVVATRRLLYRLHKLLPENLDQAEASATSTNAPTFSPNSSTKWEKILLSWRQVSNLVWKNIQIKRTKPVAMAVEVLLPVLLTGGLAVIVNIEEIINGGSADEWWETGPVAQAIASAPQSNNGFICTEFYSTARGASMGYPTEAKRTFYSNGQTVVGLFLLLVYIKFVSRTTAMMVVEKESRIREVMKIMGLSDVAVLWSWVLTTAIIATPLSLAMATLLKYASVFPQTSFILLAWLLFMFSQSITAFSYFMTPFFNKSRTAAIASVLAWIVLYFPFFAVQSKPNSSKYAAALSPATALGLAVDEMLRHAQLGTGAVYDMAVAQSPITVPSVHAMCWMLLLDCALLYALGWYVDQVLPQEHGVARRWNFLFTKSYWAREKPTLKSVESSATTPTAGQGYNSLSSPQSDAIDVILSAPDISTTAPVVESVSTTLAAQERNGTCLQIRNLRKVFVSDDTERVAVDDLSLTMYSGHITALLGHNGAGKTTTISMLTGLIPPTSGDATLFGRSIRHEFDELRQIMGICPQHDVLLSDLSVEDHLMFFGTMKNVPPQRLGDEVDKMIREVGLTEKRKVQSKNLSGGQKRKLSVALAFIGDSKLVFLDEPTSGMDPYSRRFTWNLLQRNREDHVIVLTTHFMDEADILGDRIAIMADGQLCCAGTSLFLKTRYGAGYNLTLTTSAASCDVTSVLRFLQRFIPQVCCLSNHGSEVVFQLPSDRVTGFPDMLEALELEMANLHILQYGMSVTTLEEVFLRISRDREVAGNSEVRSTPRRAYETRGCSSLSTQFSALLKKRLRITRRDRKTLLNSIGIPVLLMLIAAMIPEIQVSSFLPNYSDSLPSSDVQSSCNFTEMSSWRPFRSPDACVEEFGFCAMGIFDCDPAVCCSRENSISPYYPCNTCSNAWTECYNKQCMSDEGARAQLTLNAFLRATIVALGFAFVPAAIVAFVVREKNPIQNAKVLQLICGARPSAYWLANAVHDLLAIEIPILVAAIMVPLTSRGLKTVASDEVFAIVGLLFAHALAVIPMAYLASHRYEKHSSAQTTLLVLGMVTGGALSIISFLCRMIDVSLTSSANSIRLSTLDKSYLRWIYLLFPSYALNSGMHEIAMHRVSHRSLLSDNDPVPPSFFGLFEWLGGENCSRECWDTQNVEGCCVRSVFSWDVAGGPIIYALTEGVLFTVVLFIIESKNVRWRPEAKSPLDTLRATEEDSDVAAERRRIHASPPTEKEAIFIRNLRQQYSDGKVALDDLCLAIPKGECFGYLGTNGAGKSTTMKVLTGQIAPTNGFVTLGGYDLSRYRDKARTVLGYCPQFDSLHDLLTVREQLELYARLKGIPSSQVHEAVEQKIAEVGLTEYRDKLTRGLSGGNKRKVSTAIALMGAPQIIFLDEPSTGVDPSSRRKMWDVIASVCAENDSCVVLTTHSMEECEALSTRVGILVGGKLKCLGSVEHLKQKFGKGYTVEVKLREPCAKKLQEQVDRVAVVAGEDGKITRANLGDACRALGDASRSSSIETGEANGWVLLQLLEGEGSIPSSTFCEWWICEEQVDQLVTFFATELVGSEMVEQQGTDHFRFQVPKQGLTPSAIFRILEDSKTELHIGDYSVSDTSLEHIFNTFAAQQEEEQLVPGGERKRRSSSRRGNFV